MAAPRGDAPPRTRAGRLRVDRYVLDLDRGCTLLDGNEIALRPKTFAVLQHLIENRARLVSKDELFAAVWPDLFVTDDALVQSVGELRRALGEDGPRLIKTIPRRGYRFEADVSDADLPGRSPAGASALPATSGDVPQSPESIAVTHTKRLSVATSRAGARIGLFAALTLACLLAAGVWWSGAGWNSPNQARHADRSRAASLENGMRPAIALLPFLNQSDDASREYFADGMTQDIINALGRFSELTVMSWNAVLPYKGKPASPGEIARSLAVRYQVEGGIRQAGDRVRVNAQLVDSDGRVLWSARFDEALADLFALQDKITAEIAGALAIQVAQSEQRLVFGRPTESLEAYDYVLRARPALRRPTRANNAEARALLRRAIQLDPNYAAAYAALAETYHIAASMGWAESPSEFLGRAEELAGKALTIDDSEVRAHIMLGRVHIFYQQYAQARAEMDRALAINPNDAHGLAGRGNALMWMGQTDAAIEALEAAQRIDPELNAIDRFGLSLAYYLARRYDASIAQAELNLRNTEGANFSRVVLAAACAQLHRSEETVRAVTAIRDLDPAFDPLTFGNKLVNPADLDHLRDGFRKAGLYAAEAGLPSPENIR